MANTTADKLNLLIDTKEAIKQSIIDKGVNIDDNTPFSEYAQKIEDIETGSSTSNDGDVKFFDYDGTVVTSYTKEEFLALTDLPENPSHTGLVAQGWNWTLADAKSYVTDYGKLNIGQMYTTSSGLSEFDIELTNATGLSVNLKMNGTKDWGDGTTDTKTSHTYSSTGKYTINCDGTSMSTAESSGLFGQSATNINFYVINARITTATSISNYAFNACYSLKSIILSNNITNISNYAFNACYSLINITIPNKTTNIGNYAFCICYSVASITIPNSVITIGSNAFGSCYLLTSITIPNNVSVINASTFNGCRSLINIVLSNNITNIGDYAFFSCSSLANITIPNSVTTIGNYIFQYCYLLKNIVLSNNITSIGNVAFSNCYSLYLYDFSNFTIIPTLSTSASFIAINKLAKIVVPDDLYEDWIATTNWSNYVDYIVKASEYNQ